MICHVHDTGIIFCYREVLHQSLSIVLDILLGAGVALPHWEEEPLTLYVWPKFSCLCGLSVKERLLNKHLCLYQVNVKGEVEAGLAHMWCLL